MTKTVIGLKEKVEIGGKKVLARIDTGAKVSSIDIKLAKRLGINRPVRKTKIKSANGVSIRPVILTHVKIKKRVFRAFFTLADRKELSFPVLIGRNILKRGFLIDTSK